VTFAHKIVAADVDPDAVFVRVYASVAQSAPDCMAKCLLDWGGRSKLDCGKLQAAYNEAYKKSPHDEHIYAEVIEKAGLKKRNYALFSSEQDCLPAQKAILYIAAVPEPKCTLVLRGNGGSHSMNFSKIKTAEGVEVCEIFDPFAPERPSFKSADFLKSYYSRVVAMQEQLNKGVYDQAQVYTFRHL
jgi:hypothetical protein